MIIPYNRGLHRDGCADIATLYTAYDSDVEDEFEETAGLVLAGGAGRRLGGADKGLLALPCGTPGAAAAKSVLESLCRRVYISANRNLDTYAEIAGGRVVRDLRSGFFGPLAGLEAIRGVLRCRRLLLLPCDMPEVDPRVFTELTAALDADSSLDYAYASTTESSHYLVAALRVAALCSVTPLLNHKAYAVRGWLQDLRTASVGFDGAEAASLRNRNLPRDWDMDDHP